MFITIKIFVKISITKRLKYCQCIQRSLKIRTTFTHPYHYNRINDIDLFSGELPRTFVTIQLKIAIISLNINHKLCYLMSTMILVLLFL